jgi:hypothetical protein
VSASKVVAGIEKLGQASKVEMVDPSSFVRAAGSIGAVGEAIEQAGSVLGAVAKQRREARETTAMLREEAEIELASESFRTFTAKNPENTAAWIPEAQRLGAERIKAIQENPNLTPQGRERLLLRANTWAEKLKIQADGMGASTDFGNAKATYIQEINGAARNGNARRAEEVGQRALSSPYFSEAEKMGLKMNLEGVKQSEQLKQLDAEVTRMTAARDYEGAKTFLSAATKPDGMGDTEWTRTKEESLAKLEQGRLQTDFDTILLENPKQAQEMLEKPEFRNALPPGKLMDLEREAYRTREFAASQQTQEIELKLAQLPAEKVGTATLDSLGVEVDQLTPFHRATAEALLKKRQAVTPEARLAQKETSAKMLTSLAVHMNGLELTGDEVEDNMKLTRLNVAAQSLDEEDRAIFERLKKERSEVPEAVKELMKGVKASIIPAGDVPITVPAGGGASALVMRPAKVTGTVDVIVDGIFSDSIEKRTVFENGIVMKDDKKPPLVPATRSETRAPSRQDQEAALKVQEQMQRDSRIPAKKKRMEEDPDGYAREVMRQHGLQWKPVERRPGLFPAGSEIPTAQSLTD